MKKVLMMIIAAVSVFATAHAEKGDMGVGVNLLYGTEIETIGIGVKYQYSILDQLRLEGSFNYFFEHDHIHGWDLNANVHYLFPLGDRFSLYPLAGLTVANAGGYGNTTTKFGGNLGGGCEVKVVENWRINFEARYSIVSDIDQAVLGIGAVYKF